MDANEWQPHRPDIRCARSEESTISGGRPEKGPMTATDPKTIDPDRTSDEGLSVCVLGSGSKGNAIYVSDGQTAILIDAGLSGVEIERRLGSRGLAPDRLQAIVVSHEHADHINGVGVMSRRYRLPVYLNRKTAGAANRIGRLHCVNTFDCGTVFQIDNLHIHQVQRPRIIIRRQIRTATNAQKTATFSNEFPHRLPSVLAQGLALDIVQGDVNRRNGGRQDSPAFKVLATVEVLPDCTDATRISADQHAAKSILS